MIALRLQFPPRISARIADASAFVELLERLERVLGRAVADAPQQIITIEAPDKSDKPISVVSVQPDQCQERHDGVTAMAQGSDTDGTSLVTGTAPTSVKHVTRSPLDIRFDLRQEIKADESKGSALTPSVALRTHPSADAAGWVRGDAGAPVTQSAAAGRLATSLAAIAPASKTSGDPAVLVGAARDALAVVSAERVIAAYCEHLDGTPPQFVERPDRFLARAGWRRPVTHREPRRLAAGGAAGGGR